MPELYPLTGTHPLPGVPLGRTKVFAEIKARRLKTVTIGRRRYVTAAQLSEYVKLLECEAESVDAGSPDAA